MDFLEIHYPILLLVYGLVILVLGIVDANLFEDNCWRYKLFHFIDKNGKIFGINLFKVLFEIILYILWIFLYLFIFIIKVLVVGCDIMWLFKRVE